MKGALDRHGTRAIALPASAIIKAAEADLALRDLKRAGQRGRGMPYTFHRRHVRHASCALDLVDRAIADRYGGVWSDKRLTRVVYGDEETLRAVRMLLSPLADAAGQPIGSRQENNTPLADAVSPDQQLSANGNPSQADVENAARNPRCPQGAAAP